MPLGRGVARRTKSNRLRCRVRIPLFIRQVLLDVSACVVPVVFEEVFFMSQKENSPVLFQTPFSPAYWRCAAGELKNLRVLATIKAGEPLYRKE